MFLKVYVWIELVGNSLWFEVCLCFYVFLGIRYLDRVYGLNNEKNR